MTIIHPSRPLRRTRSLMHLLLILVAFVALPVAPIIAQSLGPQLSLSPSSAPAGTLVRATGTGFPADATGQFHWADGSLLGSFGTGPDGSVLFELIVPDVEPGVYTVSAVVETGEDVATADASLTVEAAPEQPTEVSGADEPQTQPDAPGEPVAPAPEATEAPADPDLEPAAPEPAPTEPPFYVIAGSSESENSPDAAVTYDGDPATYWITDAITPDEAFVILDLGEILPIASTRWLLATSGTLTTVEIDLSEDGANWVSLATLDGATMQAGVWIEQPVDAWARYVRFRVPNPNGLAQIGGFGEFEVWPAAGARSLAELVTPAAEPAPTEAIPAQPTETTVAVPEVTGQGVVTGTGGDGVNCRVAPDPAAAPITVVAEGTTVDLTGPPSGEWQPVLCAGQAGYISTRFLQPAAPDGLDAAPTADVITTAVASPTIPTATDAPSTPVPAVTEDAIPTSTEVDVPAAAETEEPQIGPLTFAAVADATVKRDRPNSNFGSDPVLVSDRSPMQETYLLFNVSGVSGPVEQATLRLWVTNGTNNGPKVFASSDTAWSETEITWDTRPPTGNGIGDTGTTRSRAFVEYDVTSYITGNGSYTFALIPDASDGLYVISREALVNQPELVLSASGNSSTPDITPPPPPPEPTPPEPTPSTPAPSPTPAPTPPPGETAILLAAGDIATCNGSGDEQTANILDGQPGTVATLGDNVYPDGTSSQFATCYDPSWGRHKDRTRPSAGNHDYRTSGASGYFGYFGAAAGDPGKGYYSYDLGAWHVVVLNSNIDMGANSAQVQWLTNDLASNPAACTLAYWHHPRFSSSSEHGNNPEAAPLYETLYEHGAEVVLNGHDHTYERFAPQDPNARADPAFGIRQFVVGTGGGSLYGLGSPEPNSEVTNNSTFGVLRLTLSSSGYSWNFLPVAGKTFTDSGSGDCHGVPGSGSADGAGSLTIMLTTTANPIAIFTQRLALRTASRRRSPASPHLAWVHGAANPAVSKRTRVGRRL